jgi:hypothetical protein
MPYREQAAELLARWRAAERALEAAREGNAEQDTIRAEIERLRTAYQELINRQRDAGGVSIPREPSSTS